MPATADNLYESLMLDVWPGAGAIVDFGLDDIEHYAALQVAIRSGAVTLNDLRRVSCRGPKITALLNRKKCNPRGLVFRTSYDGLFDDEPTKPTRVLEHFDKASGVGTE